ncbi:Peptidyl-prolyl cis-trans isomerase fpr2 [Apophysomyces sp. BC1034]|nr:Peptidyl-prolyl cis-trans isomerase fpr2 [Apophysomyces sp. BC1015]KAG0173562.1 Peptidyl-prolyl cis-trans isomerase fpr2 [Apophysomyces sp. BC1021]KAG0185539.1 Peptidyl-prolyl cis-trans isomerase fpr2 [Apophysomyces sp. BC1034]
MKDFEAPSHANKKVELPDYHSCILFTRQTIMYKDLLYKIALLFVLVTLVLAEEEKPQPTKLMGAVLRKPTECSQKVGSNDRIKLHYTAKVWGEDEYFENTYETNPLSYKLGKDTIMKGMNQGIKGMCPGEVRRLLIPANLAFGELGIPGKVPPNTAVIYEVEMLDVQSPFKSPWFWSGIAVMVTAYLYFDRQAKSEDASKAARFLEKKEQETKKTD